MTSTRTDIAFRNLTVSYGSRTVLRSVSGALRGGAFTALIGPNGSGKSTLLKALAGLLDYDGSIRIGERELRDHSRAELGRLVGLLFQQTALDTSLTVYDLIGLGRLPHEGLFSPETAESRRAVLSAARAMQLDDLLFAGASAISGGEAQRALLAMLLVQNPSAFLLDEPSSATDAKHSIATFSLFKKLSRESGHLVATAVHDINLALTFADYVIAVKDGSILTSCPAGEVDGSLLESLYEIGFQEFAASNGRSVWHASESVS